MKSTQIGLLKNVQDGISSPIGSREIQETKVATVLRDTLYIPKQIVKTPTTTSMQLKTTSTEVGFDTIMTVHHHHHHPPRNSIRAVLTRQGSVK